MLRLISEWATIGLLPMEARSPASGFEYGVHSLAPAWTPQLPANKDLGPGGYAHVLPLTTKEITRGRIVFITEAPTNLNQSLFGTTVNSQFGSVAPFTAEARHPKLGP